jgi:UDP-2,3-diacylglucosamine hydrolase
MSPLKTSSSRKRRSLNKIPLPGTVWIASDIHLGPQTTATRNAFHAFLNRARAQADALILCGDIFDAWVGDDFALTNPPDWLADTLDQFKQTARQIPLWLGRGNRDFLMGAPLMRYLNARLLPERSCLMTDFGPILLSHGDEYCTSDKGYQRFRKLVRYPLAQGLFLSLNLNLRRKIANLARNRSKAANRHKAIHVMDVAPSAVEKAFSSTGIATMVHGHTHHPATHQLLVDSQPRTRIVLPDWDYDGAEPPRGGWLAINRQGLNIDSLGAQDLSQ